MEPVKEPSTSLSLPSLMLVASSSEAELPAGDSTNVTTERVIKARSECKGGSGQLKLGYKTKAPLTEEERKERAISRVKSKVGEEIAEKLMTKWKTLQNEKNKVKRIHEGDGIIKTLKSFGFSDIEIKTFLKVGSGRISRVMSNKPIEPPKAPKHAVKDKDTWRIVDFVLSLDLEPGYPCAHRSLPLYVEGDNQGSSWRSLHEQYKNKCETEKVRILSYNRFREYVHHFFPTLKLGKTKTDMCNECFKIKLRLSDPDTSPEEKLNLKEKLSVHIGESSIQRRAMNAYIQLVRSRVAPREPPLTFEPCHIEEISDVVLNEALNLNRINPVLRCDPGEVYCEVDDEIENNEVDINTRHAVLVSSGDEVVASESIEQVGNVPVSTPAQESIEVFDSEKDPFTVGFETGDSIESVDGDGDPCIVGDDLGESIKSVAGDGVHSTVAIDKSACVDTENNLPIDATKVGEDILCVEGEKGDRIGTSGEEKEPELGKSMTYKLTKKAKDSLKEVLLRRTENKRVAPAEAVSKDIINSLDITIEDYGSEKPLPHYGLNRPNADYFNSSLHLRNMNIIDPSGGCSSIFLYDERSGGKDGNSVCSVRWEALKIKQNKHAQNKTKPAQHHVGIYDNCVGQNKSNIVFKFELLLTILGFFKSKNKLFLLPGHSHNSSDVKTAELNSCLSRKNLYTAQQVCQELQKVKNAETFILEKDHFYDWETFLDKYIKDMPPGFTFFYCFEIAEGKVTMKKLCVDTPVDEIVTKILVENVDDARTAILEDLFGLPPDASLQEIVNAPLRLSKMKIKTISEKRLTSIKKKYPVIPKEHLWYYPEGENYVANVNVDALGESEAGVIDPEKALPTLDKPKKKAGRPKASVKINSITPSIRSFFKAFPKMSKPGPISASTPAHIFPPTGQSQLNDPSASSRTSERDEPMDVVDLTEEEHEMAKKRSDPGMRNKFNQNLDDIYDELLDE